MLADTIIKRLTLSRYLYRLAVDNARLHREEDAYELEADGLDDLIDKLEAIRGQIAADMTDNVSVWWLTEQLDAILKPLLEDHHGSDDD